MNEGKVRHVVSVSGGKDSDATLKIALNRCPPVTVIPIFCDTDNEDRRVYEHLDYLERTTRGGRQLDILATEPASLDVCASAYGLCE